MVPISACLHFALARQTSLLACLQVRMRKSDRQKVEGVIVVLGYGRAMGSGPLCSSQTVSSYSECRLIIRGYFNPGRSIAIQCNGMFSEYPSSRYLDMR